MGALYSSRPWRSAIEFKVMRLPSARADAMSGATHHEKFRCIAMKASAKSEFDALVGTPKGLIGGAAPIGGSYSVAGRLFDIWSYGWGLYALLFFVQAGP